MMMNIYVGNLPYNTTADDLAKLFEAFGAVNKTIVIVDPQTGKSRGFGFVEMPDPKEGRQAIEELAGKVYNGRHLTINEARKVRKKSDSSARSSTPGNSPPAMTTSKPPTPVITATEVPKPRSHNPTPPPPVPPAGS
ncbi:RNA recognition motif domain-containing protein [Poriferisphaera sp. WC338]|uniref:RNA recognition motif domain-containing protein n=1 Tax=Poriferisphaera sp. WC338 TaxID=3425129 RepID=UPI003D812CB4